MIGLEAGGLGEPEIGDLGQHFAFARDAVGHDDVKGGDAVGGDEEEAVSEIEDFADLAALKFSDSWNIDLKQSVVRHRVNMKGGANRAKRKSKEVLWGTQDETNAGNKGEQVSKFVRDNTERQQSKVAVF